MTGLLPPTTCRSCPPDSDGLLVSFVSHRAVFEAELRAVLTEVAGTFDIDRLTQVVHRWCRWCLKILIETFRPSCGRPVLYQLPELCAARDTPGPRARHTGHRDATRRAGPLPTGGAVCCGGISRVGGEAAVADAVEEIDDESDYHPDEEPEPGGSG